jgi:TetR/AcrR family transcriptional regulator, regulator of autoinduction and epiphytic fitness
MPLPRFDRLPEHSRSAILTVARRHFARDGKQAASYNKIIAEAGISKTSAYNYFDGKDDLFAAVVTDVVTRILNVLEPWREVTTQTELFTQLTTGTERLLEHLRNNPQDRAILASHRPPVGAEGNSWVSHVIDNGVRIGVIDPHPNVELVTIATAAVFRALDDWALDHAALPADEIASALIVLLRRLWAAPTSDVSHT